MRPKVLVWVCLIAVFGSCVGCAGVGQTGPTAVVAHLPSHGTAGGPEGGGFTAVAEAFAQRNPGYALRYRGATRGLGPLNGDRAVFVQSGEAKATVAAGAGSTVSVGDIVLLRAGQGLTLSAEVDLLVFYLPRPIPDELPSILRPDWTPGITDTPGGCATETGAYRRVVLTWMRRNGPFNFRDLNAHRVRITDSFTHYHPEDGGFDEFYLVQMVQPGARLLVSRHTEAIVAEDLGGLGAGDVFEEIELRVGDLIYLPRGTVHRGLGGVLAHVITVPGFVPGAEIGVDHHLAAINRKNGWTGANGLPVHAAGAKYAIRR